MINNIKDTMDSQPNLEENKEDLFNIEKYLKSNLDKLDTS